MKTCHECWKPINGLYIRNKQGEVHIECVIKKNPTLLGPDEWHLTQAGKVSEMYTKDGGTTK